MKADEFEKQLALAMHELRAPLSRMQLVLEIAEQDSIPEQVSNSLSAEIKRMESAVQDFLDIIELADESSESAIQLTDVNRLVFETVSRNHLLAAEYGTTLSTIPHSPAASRRLDEKCLDRILDQLVVNAISYAGEGSQVEVGLEEQDNSLILRVRDTGPGIRQQLLPKLLKAFSRGESARRLDRKGAGLGLAYVSRACEARGWILGFENRKPHGLQVSIRIP